MHLLTERAAIWSYTRNGRVSLRGATRSCKPSTGDRTLADSRR